MEPGPSARGLNSTGACTSTLIKFDFLEWVGCCPPYSALVYPIHRTPRRVERSKHEISLQQVRTYSRGIQRRWGMGRLSH
ncbi:hypothetical protein MPTK1_2g05820 [Marchantia polymorpha subsp. ruderalis]|uniref:Uncharacterized protein n=1 Tax=Marchantia polymorpha TaxID=3197 RepID=A0A2R6XDI9_MARPO|nr:hypothetical protein MARPO_0021s0038 [Marchantia polymorpha]BBN01236.1 hypothetical protein Mp_2g05820 [Marchantia polymorpha subsp. ruderalis]|eukprot:PTQ44162.1 hypothetical protein MARPO_0021s0038 [Marchantia polymorpha]